MLIPTIHGIIERRMLLNYVVDSECIRKILPIRFRPKLYDGMAVVGICLIRLKNIKPKGFPDLLGIKSENGAHRIAVEWDDETGKTKEGVYIPRRDTNLRINTWVGGRIFPGKHYFAKFNIQETNDSFHLNFKSSDGAYIEVEALRTNCFASNSIFKSLENASSFFANGSVGYSPNGNGFEGLELTTYNWKVEPLEVKHVKSSFFDDKSIFPAGSIRFDNALLMESIEHEWKAVRTINAI